MPYTGNYISDTDIATWPSGTSDAEKQADIERAEAIFEAAVGRAYRPKPFDIYLNGNGENRLFIPLHSPIVTITAVYIFDILLDASLYSYDSASLYLDLGSSGAAGATLLYWEEIAEGDLFPRGKNNIRIKGTCGQGAAPSWAKDVVKIIVDQKNDPSLYTEYKLGSESIGSYSYSGSAGTNDKAYKTGIEEADKIIRLFARKKVIIITP